MTSGRSAPVDMSPEEFRKLGHRLIDQIAEFLRELPKKPVTPSEEPTDVGALIGRSTPLPKVGTDAGALLDRAAELMFNHSLFNGHPRFWGYITASPTPIGMLGDLLASAANSNLGSWKLGPMATEIESQTIRWIAELIGYPTDCGGILVSGGNMANFVGFLAARRAKAEWDIRELGATPAGTKKMVVYTSAETHTWIQKAADLFGLGTASVRWIPTDKQKRMNTNILENQIQSDLEAGLLPIMVVGTAGTVSTGAVDPLFEIDKICRKYKLWFHVDGAYGGFAAKVPGTPHDLKGMELADSVAVDPHKWLYAPIEVGCALVRTPAHMTDAFSYHPPYYHFDDSVTNYVDYGMQNSRGFRALKVWLALQQVGSDGYVNMIGDDIRLAEMLYRLVDEQPELERFTQGLSITTFRFVPMDLRTKVGHADTDKYLNKLNEEIMLALERSGEAFVSHAIIDGVFVLRVCVVNFRTSEDDMKMFPALVCQLGTRVDRLLRPEHAKPL